MRVLLVLLLLAAGCRERPTPNTQHRTPSTERPAPGGVSLQVKSGHPKIWLDTSRLQWLRANPTRPEWKRLLDACNVGFGREAAGLPLVYDSPLNYALVYAVTKSEKHARLAVKLVEQYIAMGPEAMTKVGAVSPHMFGSRIVLPEVAVSYDWLYDFLTPAQRQRWADALMAWSDQVWLETNPTRSTWAQNAPGDNFFAGYLMSLVAALAVSGEHPRAQTHMDLGLAKLAMLNDYLARYGKGAVSLEGTNYGTWIRHGYLLAALTTAGVNLPTVGTASFLTDVAVSRWELTAPDRKHLAPLGTQAVDRSAPIQEAHRAAVLVAMASGDPQTKALAKAWLDSTPVSRQRANSWLEALWYDPRGAAPVAMMPPLTWRAEGSGYVSFRSSWAADTPWVWLQCGPVKESHQSYAAGEFGIWNRGEWLTGPARLWGGAGDLLPSDYANVIRVGNRGQPGQITSQRLPKDAMQVVAFAPPNVTVEGARAYDFWQWPNVVPVLDTWNRTLSYSSPGKITVRDRVVKVNASDPVVWQLHCQSRPSYRGQGYTVLGANGKLTGRVTEPANASLGVEPINKGPGGAVSSYRLEVTVPGGTKEVTMVNELQVSP